MATGTVNTVDTQAGHGTITPDTPGKPIYFVMDCGRRPLRPGERVSYSVQLTEWGLIARGVFSRQP